MPGVRPGWRQRARQLLMCSGLSQVYIFESNDTEMLLTIQYLNKKAKNMKFKK